MNGFNKNQDKRTTFSHSRALEVLSRALRKRFALKAGVISMLFVIGALNSDSVFAQTSGVLFEVILVDNASTDGSIELFEKDDRICFVESGGNLGFGKANNLGYNYATGKYLFLLNSDTLLLNNAIKEFFLQMEQRAEDLPTRQMTEWAIRGYAEHSSMHRNPCRERESQYRFPNE